MLRFILREVQLPTFRKSGTASYSRQLFSLSTCWAAEVTQPEVFPSQVTLYHPTSCAFNCFVSFLLPLHPVDNICISSLVCLSGLGDPVGLILPWTAQLLLLFRLLSQAGCGFAHCSSSQVQWRDCEAACIYTDARLFKQKTQFQASLQSHLLYVQLWWLYYQLSAFQIFLPALFPHLFPQATPSKL